MEQLIELSAALVTAHWRHVRDLAVALLRNGRIVKSKEIRQVLGPRTMPLRTAIDSVRRALQHTAIAAP
jgi:hypothetical protein